MTPHSLTVTIAGTVAVLCTFIIGIYQWINNQLDPFFLLTFALVVLVSVYLLTRVMIQRYINLKIKPIYHIIQRSKTNQVRRITGKDFNSNVIKNVDKDVENWASSKEQEIESLKSLEQYRKDYVGNVSHELKTPIFAIQGYIHTLLEGVEDKKLERKFLKRAAENSERLSSIVSDLETITRIEAGIVELDREKFDARALLVNVVQDLQGQAENVNIKLTIKNKETDEFFIYADKEAVQKVLINLVSNSLKYGKENGETILNIYDVDEFILIEVSDDGLGIDEHHLNHLFDRFYRVDKSRNRQVAGSGLGLSIVKHLVEAHGQDINVRSTIGQGSTFGFTMPKA